MVARRPIRSAAHPPRSVAATDRGRDRPGGREHETVALGEVEQMGQDVVRRT